MLPTFGKIKAVKYLCNLILVGLWFIPNASGHPSYIGEGQPSCVSCHVNPAGGGALSDYGRAMSASSLSTKMLFSEEISESGIESYSGFLWKTKLPRWFRPEINYQGHYINRAMGRPQSESEYVHQFLEATVVSQHLKNDALTFVASAGVTPARKRSSKYQEKVHHELISRNHYGQIKLTPGTFLMAGAMEKIYGLRVGDKSTFSRQRTGIAFNDQVHAVALLLHDQNMDTGFQIHAGNLYQEKKYREQGANFSFEFGETRFWRIGLSGSYSKSETLTRMMGALHFRVSPDDGVSLISEFGVIDTNPESSRKEFGLYGLLKGQLKITRGLNFYTAFEVFNPEIGRKGEKLYRAAPGIQFSPIQRLSIKGELRSQRATIPDAVYKDTWDMITYLTIYI